MATLGSIQFLKDFPVGIFLIDKEYKITVWNSRLEHWTELAESEIVGTDLRETFPEFKKRTYSSRIKLLFEGGPAVIFSSLLHRSLLQAANCEKSGMYNITATSAKNTDGMEYQVMFVIENVSGLHQRTQELEKSNLQLESFVRTASHDLKAPLRMINQFSLLLEKKLGDNIDENIAKYLSFITGNAQHMENMLEALLAYSRACYEKLNVKSVALNTPIDQALNALSGIISTSGAKIHRDDFPTFKCDSMMISLVFQNLIGNALKYIKDKAPEINICALNKNGQWIFSISDNGIGMKNEDTEKIFAPFKRLHGMSTYEGTGIGLSTCENIVKRHGGKIWVESEPDVGSTFFFTLN